MPREIYDEVAQSSDVLGDWLRQPEVKAAIILSEPTDPSRVRHVIGHGYAHDLNDIEVESLGRDPFLIAAGLGGLDRVIVTREVSRPSKLRANRKIPDVCGAFGLRVINDFALYRELKFSIT
jgi:hypothetical protein